MWLFGLGQGPYGFLEIDESLISGVDTERTQADISALKITDTRRSEVGCVLFRQLLNAGTRAGTL